MSLNPKSYAAQGLALPVPRVVTGSGTGQGSSILPPPAPGELVPTSKRGLVNLRYEPENMSGTATVGSVQSAIRAAEGGDTRALFGLYRDLSIAGSHVYCELSKRKLAVLGQPFAILPEDKEDAADVAAAEAIKTMIADCENWTDGLIHLMDSVIWPVSVVEKIFQPAGESQQVAPLTPALSPLRGEGVDAAGRSKGSFKVQGSRLRYTLKRLEVVNPTLLCFRQPYAYAQTGGPDVTGSGVMPPVIDPLAWEADLRFYSTDATGRIFWNWYQSYAAEPMRHLVHRGHLMVGIRDNWGGPMRAVIFWWLLGVLGRDWFARYMERYGAPWPVAKTDANSTDSINFLKSALSLSQRIGGLIVDHDTEVELLEAMTANGADAYDKFLSVCNREISKVILGQTLSAEAQPTGLGSATGKLQGEVRAEVSAFDKMKLGETLRRNLFVPFLEVNGIAGRAPKIVWGGESPEDSKACGELLVSISQSGLEPTDEALPTISERVGFQVQRKAAPVPAPGMPVTPVTPLSAAGVPAHVAHPSDGIAARKAAVLAAAFRGSLAPVREIILSSGSPEEAQRRLQKYYADWDPQRVVQVTEEALQLCAAAGV